MKAHVFWILRAGAALALLAMLAGCGAAPVAQSQSGSVSDPRSNETTSLDQELLRQVDGQLAAARAQGKDVASAQTLRDSAVDLAKQGQFAAANGNLKWAATLVGVLRPAGDAPPPAPRQPIPDAPALPAASGDQGPVLMNATFASSADLRGWQRVGPAIPIGEPRWEIQDGMLVQRGVEGSETLDEQTGLVTGDPAWRDVTVRVSVLARDIPEVGVIVRQQNENYYRFRAISVETGTNQGNLILEKVVDGQLTHLAAFAGPALSQNVWHTLAVMAQGSTIRCYVDGTLVGSTEDSTLSAGRAGVSTLAMSGAFFKSLQVIGR